MLRPYQVLRAGVANVASAIDQADESIEAFTAVMRAIETLNAEARRIVVEDGEVLFPAFALADIPHALRKDNA